MASTMGPGVKMDPTKLRNVVDELEEAVAAD
jgi:hypothetical protein